HASLSTSHSSPPHTPTTTDISTLSLHDALPISLAAASRASTPTASMPVARGCATRPCSSSRYADGVPHCSNSPSARTFCDGPSRSEEHTSELQSRFDLVCRLLLEKKNTRSEHST